MEQEGNYSKILPCAKTVRLLRVQRHEFMNHLQIIHSTIQLGRLEKALRYIEEISKDDDWLKNLLEQSNQYGEQ